ncbi:MAG: YhbY family RNA-binding protein [Halarsenatibacteraceae bacterium]
MKLTGKDRSYLRAEGHGMDPLLQVGKDGLSESTIDKTEELLTDHELIKLRVLDNNQLSAKESANKLAELTESSVVQVIGNVALLYRENPEISGYNIPQ